MKRSDLTSGIKPPKYKVGRFILNEYEAREMIARICEGTLDPKGIILTDEDGNKFTFNKDGERKEYGTIKGFDISSNFTLRKLRATKYKDRVINLNDIYKV